METRYLKTLVVAAETGSFSRAAELLHITQSAVSQRIKFLEERFGHQLLDRSGAALAATPAGELVLEKARAILAKEQELSEELKRLGGEKRLSLCCTPTFGMAYLPGVLNDFMLQHADLANLKFIFHQPEQALRGLQENEFDLAIIEHCDNLETSPCHTISLPEDELVFISAPAQRLAGSPLDLSQLLGYRLYARKDGCSSKQLLKLNLATLRKEIDDFASVVVSDDLRFTIQAVQAGGGVAFVSRSLVSSLLENGTLCAHHVRDFRHFRHRSALLQKNRTDDMILKTFLQCVLAAFAARAPALAPASLEPEAETAIY